MAFSTHAEIFFSLDLLDQYLVPFLTLAENAHLEVVKSCTHKIFSHRGGWGSVACREMPRFSIAHLIQKTPASRAKKLLETLRSSAVVMSSFPVSFTDFEQASALADQIAKVERRAADHLRKGGDTAQVNVGYFRFPQENQISGLGKNRTSPMHSSSPFTTATACYPFSSSRPRLLAPPNRDSPRKVPLNLKLWHCEGMMFVNAETDGHVCNEHASEGNVASNALGLHEEVVIDVQVVKNEALVLHIRDAVVIPNGSAAVKGSGIFLAKGSESGLRRALHDGILCVVLVRDHVPSLTNRDDSIVNALNIELSSHA
jgi:hypothetical protein